MGAWTPAAGVLVGGRYRFERRLAKGGMASVWLARDERLGRPVAVKAMSEALAEDEEYLLRFAREAKVAARIAHPNLVRVFDYGAGERPYLVMEYVEDGSLATRIEQGTAGELDHERLVRDLLGALGAIHAAGVVHRDVKPANVLIDEHGHARLTDFGIARPRDATSLTETGQVLGTLRYIAPEVLAGGEADPRSDLYSLGILFREVAGEDRSPALAGLTDALTAPDPSSRPASASSALAILDRGQRMASATASGPGGLAATPPGASTEQRWRRPLIALIATAIGALLLVAVLTAGGDDDEPPKTPVASKREPSPDAGSQPDPSAPPPAPPPAQALQPTEEPPAPPPDPCAGLEDEKHALDEERKAAEEKAKEDEEAREEVTESFEEQKKALEERIKECKEAEKARGREAKEGEDGEG